jgi:peptide/nickel transport system substrate-binding protein
MVATACSSGDTTASTAAGVTTTTAAGATTTTTAAGGETPAGLTTLQGTMSEEATDLIPHTTTQQGKRAVLQTLLMPIVEAGHDTTIISNILESWEQSPDARVVTFRLRPDIEWSDGTPMTSADLHMSLTQYLDNNISNSAGRIGGVLGQAEFVDGSAETIEGLTIVDDLTLTVELANPDAAWVPNLAALGPNLPVLPSHVLGDVPHDQILDHDYFRTFPVTSGPYKFVQFQTGQFVEFERNDNWSLGTPGFESVFFKILSTDVMSAQLETGEIQFMFPVDPADTDRIGSIGWHSTSF